MSQRVPRQTTPTSAPSPPLEDALGLRNSAAGPVIQADVDSTPHSVLLHLLETAQAHDRSLPPPDLAVMDSADNLAARDTRALSPPAHASTRAGAPGSDEADTENSLTAMMLAERHSARQRQRQADLAWDEADTRQRRNSLLSAFMDAGPWTESDAWLSFGAGQEEDENDAMDEELAAILSEVDDEDDDDDAAEFHSDSDMDSGEGDSGLQTAFRAAAAAFPHSSEERQNALSALLQIGSFGAPASADGLPVVDVPMLDEPRPESAPARDRGEPGSGRPLPATGRQPSARTELDIQRDLDALLQGRLLGTEPLNFSPRAGRPYAPRLFDAPRTSDPASALSYTSFLRPGTTYVGEQRFPLPVDVGAQHWNDSAFSDGVSAVDDPLQLDLRRWREAHGLSSGIARPVPAMPPGGVQTRLPPWHSRLVGSGVGRSGSSSPSAEQRGTSSAAAAAASSAAAGRSETSPLLGSLRPRGAATNTRYAPYTSTSIGSGPSHASPPQPSPGLPPALGAATGASARPAGLGSGSLDSLAARTGSAAGLVSVFLDDALDRAGPAVGGAEGPDGKAGDERERWGVKVSIDTYDPVQRQLSGFMAAHGITVASRTDVPISAHSPTVKSDITTFFTGQILHPILDGLFTTPFPSRTEPAGWSIKPRLTRSHEADAWVQIGPFKGMKSSELLEKGKDRQWVQEMAKGWLLCRWKEKEFINVAAKDAPLSISGHYQIALDRRTGEVEGLYIDPFAAPQQRLVLSPSVGDSGAVAFGSYSYR